MRVLFSAERKIIDQKILANIPIKVIAKEFGVNISTIYQNTNLRKPKKDYSSQLSKIISMRKEGIPYKKISSETKIPITTIFSLIEKNAPNLQRRY